MPELPATRVVTRFAPSPTGEVHLGNARTALFCFLLARRARGSFILRIEDTDAERGREEHVAALLRELGWLGLEWDEGPDRGGPSAPYRQSQRGEHYARRFAELERAGHLYPCFCTPLELEVSRRSQLAAGRPPRYAGTCRDLGERARAERLAGGAPATLRFRVPPARLIEFVDFVHGAQRFHSDDIGDFIVRRADGSAAFFFCNAVDDAEMGVTHVLRGEDHLTNTPRQLLLIEALGLTAPAYGHVSLLVGDDGAPLSKRHGSTTLRELRERGYLPLAVANHLFRLGHSCAENGLLPLAAMAAAFDPKHLGRSPARFDREQLESWQKDAAHHLSAEEARAWLAGTLPPGLSAEAEHAFLEAVRPNVVLPEDAERWSQVIFGALPTLAEEDIGVVRAAGPGFFAAAARAATEHGDLKAIAGAARDASGRKGPELYMPLRLALTGLRHGPELAPLLRAMPATQIEERLARFAH